VDHDAPAARWAARARRHPAHERPGHRWRGADPPDAARVASGTPLTLLVSRDGQQMTVTTQTANREEVERQAWEQHLNRPRALPPARSRAASTSPLRPPRPPVRGGNSFSAHADEPSYTGAMLETMSKQLATSSACPAARGCWCATSRPTLPRRLPECAPATWWCGPTRSRGQLRRLDQGDQGQPRTATDRRGAARQEGADPDTDSDSKRRSSLEQPSQDSERAVLAPIGFFCIPLHKEGLNKFSRFPRRLKPRWK